MNYRMRPDMRKSVGETISFPCFSGKVVVTALYQSRFNKKES